MTELRSKEGRESVQRPGVGGNRVCSENRELSTVAGAKRRVCVARELEGPAKTQLCWAWNSLYSGSNEKPLDDSKNRFLWQDGTMVSNSSLILKGV